MRVLGLDVGAKRIGVALSDESRMLASPHLVYERQGTDADVRNLVEMARTLGCTAIVFGLPLELNGTKGLRARRVDLLFQKVAAAFEGECHYVDERFSTSEAERVLIASDVRRQHRKRVVDKVAAALILQAYLDGLS